MSNYRNSATWNKGTSTSNSKLSSPYKYEASGVGKTSGTDARSKLDDDKKSTPTLRIQAPKFGNSLYNAGYQRNTTSASKEAGNYSNRSELPRLKTALDRKESLHPPVSYRPLTKTTPRSRDPSPVAGTDRSTASSSTSYNRLAPPSTFRRSVSRERTNSTSSIGSINTPIPRYSGRSSLNQDDLPSNKKYSNIGRTDKYEDSSSKYKNIGRTTSREDLSSSKYITSRFLPKNTIEKSYSGYSRGSSSLAKANEASRKNREILNVIHAQEQGRSSRSISRCSSINLDHYPQRSSRSSTSDTTSSHKEVEMIIINVVTRATSPTFSKPSSLIKPRRIEIANTVEKQVMRPKHKDEMVDKAIQSDRLDDTTKNSKFAGASRITATSWNSMLDMKFSSPNKKITKSSSNSSESSGNEQVGSKKRESTPTSLHKSNSNKSVGHSCVPEEKANKSSGGKNERKLLPPQIPTRDSSGKSIPLHLSSQQNKDFRKSILNMSDLAKRKVGRRSNSVSSADSESEIVKDSEATDISENLTSCKSFHNSASLGSKLPQKMGSEKSLNGRSRRSPSSDLSLSFSSANASGNEEETKVKLKEDKVFIEQSSKQQEEPKNQNSNPENLVNAQAKSFLTRALAPVTNLFKAKQEPENEVKWVLGSGSEENSEGTSIHQTHQEGGPPTISIETQGGQTLRVPTLRNVPSGEIPWWLDENSEIPEGIQIYPNWVKEDGTTTDGKVIYKLRKNESGNSSWWNDSSENSEANRSGQKEQNQKNLYKMRRNDSAKSSWWLESSDNSATEHKNMPTLDGEYLVQKDENGRISYRKRDSTEDGNTIYVQQLTDEYGGKMYKLRKNDSSKSSWWLDSSESSGKKNNQNEERDYLVQRDESGRVLYKIRKNDSVSSSWWNDSNENSAQLGENDGQTQQTLDSEYLELHKIRHIDSGERAWWLSSQENIADVSRSDDNLKKPMIQIRHQDSGEPAWWLQNEENVENVNQPPLGDRASPEGLEMPKDEGRLSPYDNVPETKMKPNNLFISKHTNIDDILGGSSQMYSPLMEKIFNYQGDMEGDTLDGGQNMGQGIIEGTGRREEISNILCSYLFWNFRDRKQHIH